MATIGFIGLGNMGAPMAGNLVKKGHEVKGFDLVAGNLEKAAARGVTRLHRRPTRPRDVDAVVTMLPAGKDTLAVWGGGMLRGGGARHAVHRFLHHRRGFRARGPQARRRGQDALARRAGVGRRRRRGGGDAHLHVRRRQGGLRQGQADPGGMGKRIVHCGEAGAGQAAKICNNMMLAVSMIGVCEAFVLAEKLGLSHQALFDVASTSSGQCWALTSYCPVPGPVPSAPSNNKLQGRVRLRADAEGPEAGAGGGQRPPARPRRWARPPRRSSACTTPGAKAAPTSPASST